MKLEAQKENMYNMILRTNANDTNVGFFMFKPLDSLGALVLQTLTILFGVLIIYMGIKVIFGSAYINPIDNRVSKTVSQALGAAPQTGGSLKKLFKLFNRI